MQKILLNAINQIKNCMKKSTLIFCSIFFAGATHAQLGNFLKDVKNAADSLKNGSRVEQPLPADTAKQAASPVVPAPTPMDAKKTAENGPPEKNEYVSFQCKIKGKKLFYGNNFDSDDVNIAVRMENIHPKPLDVESDWRTTQKEPLYIMEESGDRVTVTTVYFKFKQMTYGISFCEGMMCGNPDQPYSFAVFNGEKKVSQDFCDEGSASEFNFPVKLDNKGKLISTFKEVIVVKKSPLKFNPFN